MGFNTLDIRVPKKGAGKLKGFPYPRSEIMGLSLPGVDIRFSFTKVS